MSDVRSYRDLIAWQKAMDLTVDVYRATDGFPKSEEFGLQGQMRRAAVSIPSNVAEGYARQTTKDYLRFLRMARGSAAELSTQCEVAMRLRLMPSDCTEICAVDEVERILVGLIDGIKRSKRRRQ
jgi:four helix bundle protein